MWTPRRILLLLLGLAGSLSAYVAYTAALGGVDGLPDLPTKLLVPAPPGQEFVFSDQHISPTYLQLQQAFGPNSPEVLDTVAYKTRLSKRDDGLVFACGQMNFERPVATPFVGVSPFSVAFFGKEKPDHLRQPGEVQEISTFHADKAVLQFDRPVGSPQDLSGKNPAKLIGMELVSVPDMPSHDIRRGQIWITNNQKSADPGHFLVFRTPGPLFYRVQDGASPDAPQVWTTAAVEVVDKRNLPRPLRSGSTATALVRGDEFRARNAVADILLGITLPPPTMTAEGMKIYLDRQDDKTPAEKRNSTGYSGVRMIELTEKVQVNLWSDGGGGFPGSPSPDDAKPAPAAVDPPAGFAAVAGGAAADGAAVARRFEDKTLLVIQTLGPFRYDFADSRARFEAAAVAPEAVPNHVTVARHSARGTQDNLFCKVLEIDFLGGEEAKAAGPAKKSADDAKPSSGQGMRIKSLTATGPYVFVEVESEQLKAQGTELHYTVDAKTRRSDTTLRGNPVVAVRDRNRLEGGSVGTPSELFISTLSPAPGSKDRKQTKLEVRGPGTIKMFDPATGDTTLTASWGKSLTHEKEKVGDVEQDLLKFAGGGTFEDRKGEMTLSGDQLWLWLAPGDGKSGPTPVAAAIEPPGDLSKSLPQRLLAVGRVKSQSPELVIHNTDQLNVWFRDVPPPPPEPQPKAVAKVDPTPAAGPTAEPPLAGRPPEKKDEPEKAKHPVHLSARVIESWVVRYPRKLPATKADPKAGQTALRYELEKARCEDRVVVHQDPDDPLKNPRGLDITGSKLNLDATRAGSVMTVTGTAQAHAEVHFESISLYGPTVVIDQPTNAVSVDGVGKLVMPAQADLTGNAPNRPTELEVNWTKSMRFFGAKARAEFFGQVQAVQRHARRSGDKAETAPVPRVRASAYRPDPAVAIRPGPPPDDGSRPESWVLCHRLDVTFDRPVYFNNARRQEPKPAPGQVAVAEENPRLKTAQCTPMPDDEAAKLPPRNAELARRVFYIETLIKDGKVIKAQRINAVQIDLANDAEKREQQVIATGPGDVRILQFGAKEALGQPARPAAPGQPAEQEMKLTLVKFPSRMVATDKGKLYQEAVFDDGGRVWQVPTENLNLEVVAHDLPERTVHLECSQRLTVSSSKVRPDAPAEQRLTAVGNAIFEDGKYRGTGHSIQDDGRVTVLTGSDKRMAHLYQLRRTVNEQDHYSGRQFQYYRDGRIVGAQSGRGSLRTGP